ncbi:uncharacterized protein LOC129883603 [Solanum dulcamara]|uniref:uncharacterized protein LOC129883603 n=1 Tax=Solanum dulcamara TaxID=45834 RepID=UPI0024851578|nr:uncharacterized protein LOC129883603 [Solanum dulcamara]
MDPLVLREFGDFVGFYSFWQDIFITAYISIISVFPERYLENPSAQLREVLPFANQAHPFKLILYYFSKISRYFSDPQYYFQVNDQYVRNKLTIVLFPFLHRGHWTRITEPVGGRLSYKPPIYDINAPDLYIPFMAFGTYVVLASLSLGLQGRFSPEALSWLFIKGLVGWFLQVSLSKVTLFSLGSGEALLLDIVSYAGYAFAGLSIALLGTIIWNYSYYFLMPWTCLYMGIFLVKTMKRVLFAEVRTYDSSSHHYLLLFIALAQFPLLFWLGKIGLSFFF